MFDGEVHWIEPQALHPIRIGGRNWYIMEYYDYSANTQAITMLIDINGVLAKVPLDNYDILNDFITDNTLASLDINQIKLPSNISLAETISAKELLSPTNPPDNHIEKPTSIILNEYVPINVQGITTVKGGTFSSAGAIIELNGEEVYHYDKTASFELKTEQIQYGLNHYYIDDKGIKRYDFEIDVPEGTTGKIYMVDDEGMVKTKEVLIIPGKHEYHAIYSDFVQKEDYGAAKQVGKMNIKAHWPEYKDRHDRDRAFRDGGIKILEMEFINHSGKKIGTLNSATYRTL